ncbi:hypothetical protein F5B22DRAFT_640964 [Xylaria bambusicola]|uniref:uncharacterized protein n=1 Tax=Xylaria bambusicola TaxID=326684 RepID=UPI0020086A5B|nr:uncharacterized protein F5B22DRAFT_640964 [Xylaria bambusicola]KAI0527989.1 hypothetical protein F5B22DRAFT_640964 [Xylaria bambusicola]
MSHESPNYDFLESMDDGMWDDILADINFSTNEGPNIEQKLADDFPGKEVQQTPTPEVPSDLQLEATISTATFAHNNEMNSQSQYINPQDLNSATAPPQIAANFANANGIARDLICNEPSYPNYACPTFTNYAQNFPMGPLYDANGQLVYCPPGQILYPTMHPPVGYRLPYMNAPTHQPNPQQQFTSPQMSHQRSPRQPISSANRVLWKSQLSPVLEKRAPKPGRQSLTRKPPKHTPERRSGAADSSNPSSLPLKVNSRHSKQPPSADTLTTRPPLKRPAKDHNGVFLLNGKIPRKTHGKRKSCEPVPEPERYYGPSPPKPHAWGPRDSKGRHLFTYTAKGELSPGLFLSIREMRSYLLGPNPREDFDPPARLPGVKLARRKIRQGLTLWIGWPTPMSNFRYPRGGESTKCRFESCRFNHTIALGEPWVIFDERQNVDGEMINPFHNAGYVHLFCLEYHFDIIDLWHLVDIRPDYRSFKRECHPYFSLEHKLSGIDFELKTWWIATYEQWWQLKCDGKKRVRDHPTSLTNCLINFKLDREPTSLMRNREKRVGIDMAKHRGDPELKRKYRLYKQYGLLDEMGFPTADAAAQLQLIESQQRATKMGPPMPSQPIPTWDNGQQSGPTFSTGGGHANLVHLNQPLPADHPYAPKALNIPLEGATGQKRSHEDITDGTTKTPSPKRQRLHASTVPQTLPSSSIKVDPIGSPGVIDMYGKLQAEPQAELLTEANTAMDISHEVGEIKAEPQKEDLSPSTSLQSLPNFSGTADLSLDDIDELFHAPEEIGEPETPPDVPKGSSPFPQT